MRHADVDDVFEAAVFDAGRLICTETVGAESKWSDIVAGPRGEKGLNSGLGRASLRVLVEIAGSPDLRNEQVKLGGVG